MGTGRAESWKGAMKDLAFVMIGSALGGMARFWLSGVVARKVGETFPWGTISVNVSGSFALGVVAAAVGSGAGWLAGPEIWPFAVTGFLGCYTTVSSFSLQTLSLLRDGERRHAMANVALSVALCLLAAAAGFFGAAGVIGSGYI